MSTTCIITLGTSDLQFSDLQINDFNNKNIINKINTEVEINEEGLILKNNENSLKIKLRRNRDHDGSYLLASPRKDGKIIMDNFDLFKNIIEMPLIIPVIENWPKNENPIIKIITIVTDQNNPEFSYNDTIYIGKILENFLKYKIKELKEINDYSHYLITENLTDIDYQYTKFGQVLPDLIPGFNKENDDILLIAQGGIDQINHALTLQLIYKFGDSVNLFQKPEKANVKELKFTSIFLQDLAKKQVESLINSLAYNSALKISSGFKAGRFRIASTLIKFGHFRSIFLYQEADKEQGNLGNNCPEFIKNYKDRITPVTEFSLLNRDNSFFRIIEKFYISEYLFKIGNYTDFAISFQVFQEYLVCQYISIIYELDLINRYYDDGNSLIRNLNEETKVQLKLQLGLNENRELILSFPSLAGLAIINSFNTIYSKLFTSIENTNSILNGYQGGSGLDILRNRNAHEGIGIQPFDLYLASNIRPRDRSLSCWQGYLNDYKQLFNLGENPYEVLNTLIINKL